MKKIISWLIICVILVGSFTQNSYAAVKKDMVKEIVTKFDVKQGKYFNLPSKVQILLRTGKKETVAIKWDKYSHVLHVPGKTTVSGTITKYNEKEKFTVNVLVSKDKVSEYEPLNINTTVYVGESIQLPTSAYVYYTVPGFEYVHYPEQEGYEKITWYPVDFGTFNNNVFYPSKAGHYKLKFTVNKLKEVQYIDIHVIQIAEFENTELENAIKDYLEKENPDKKIEFTTEYLESITDLSLDTSKVKNLSGIEKLKNLRYLWLSINSSLPVGYIEPLKRLSKLKDMDIAFDNAVVDNTVVNEILKLKLESLYLYSTMGVLDNLNELENSSLKKFDFYGYVKDYSALQKMQSKISIVWLGKTVDETIEANNIHIQEEMENKLRQSKIKLCESKIKEIISQYITPDMDDRTKIKTIHDYIVNNTRYDHENYLNDTIPEDSYYAYGVILNGVGVCSGYAKAFYSFMKELGIECYYVTGEATNSVGSTGGHAWNIVKVDGVYRQIDTTWDDPVCSDGQQRLRYNYFLITDEDMSKNHTWDKTQYPECK